ncbi:hypothetical protein FH972_026339 [Carpinus fangiana]|uniref:Disease resistance R13L4/SHOC-2-like LRR domain-containing protein n=1 Tax=Carpinus fangiana TaxID=176857 RepID=A0A5N6L3N1_9ROSI|nr:hypothetical protein FH972_026339 [Carpinus fangiana]
MPSSDQCSGAGSANFNVAGINDVVLPDVVSSLQQVEDFLSQNRPNNNGSSHSSQDEHQIMGNEVEMLKKDLIYIRESFKNLKVYVDTTNALLNALKQRSSFNDLLTGGLNVSSRDKQIRAKLRAINEIVMELKLRIPLPYKLSSKESDAHRYTGGDTEFDDSDVIDDLPVLHVDTGFRNSLAFNDFRSVYESLDSTTKLCLLCFALIPENEIVKKRFMTYWWVGEGFVSPEVDDGTLEERLSVEEVADEIFEQLAKKHCIEPVNEKHRRVVDSYKMNPFIRSAVIVLAKEAGFFDFDDRNWNPSANFKTSYRACLVDGFSQQLAKSSSELDPKKLQTIFNVNEPYPDFFKSEWFSKFKNVKVLYLGRWQSSAKHHIEVDGVEFLEGLKSMKLLRLLSLQGILGITELPDSVCKLLNLRILDLRACQNLEALPNGIGSLVNLTRLDLSECYSLDYMPKGIMWLSKLRVLKRFVIGNRLHENSCTLDDLSGLKELRKLSIYTITEDFPNEDDEIDLQKFENLESCQNLEALPNGIGSLVNLTRLDLSECYSLDYMPKGIMWLSKLRVLKRFVIGNRLHENSCTLDDLSGLKELRKLSIYTITEDFPNEDDEIYLQKFKNLEKLTIEWEDNQEKIRAAALVKTLSKTFTFKQGGQGHTYPQGFEKLKKLDLNCYPLTYAPSWLRPGKLLKLEKLYIRRGNLRNLSPGQENEKWKVNILRLKFLSNLKMDWKELLSSFPGLIYLEKYKCPKLTFFPCNENGIVLKPRNEAGKIAAARYNIVY